MQLYNSVSRYFDFDTLGIELGYNDTFVEALFLIGNGKIFSTLPPEKQILFLEKKWAAKKIRHCLKYKYNMKMLTARNRYIFNYSNIISEIKALPMGIFPSIPFGGEDYIQAMERFISE